MNRMKASSQSLINQSDVNMEDIQMLQLGYARHPIGAIVIAITGLAIWLLGYRLVKVIVIAAAFILSGWSFFVFSPHLIHLEVCCGPGTQVEVRIAISIIVALVAGAIACYVYKLGVFCLGSCLGLVLSIVVTALVLRKILHSPLAYYGIYSGSALLLGILAVVFEKIFVILATSVFGALGVFYAIDFIVRTPFTPTMTYALKRLEGGLYEAVNDPSAFHLQLQTGQLTDKAIAMYVGWLLMSLAGCLIQFAYTSQEISSKLMVKTCGVDRDDLCDDEDKLVHAPRYILLDPSPISTRVHHYGKAQRIRTYLR